ncbi:hypothetical protein KDW_63770 [Dictyobacter vulcani]|uniref:Uncharacterized protein n=1 Tax=Dictyobacter vulcani TaxID=2607529 RepID=A0A5J4KW67_9CHLR|nr:hypothetical protein [Dictyobacter vulcani]GER92215.1 hypothetical protein KDW_63770 [Dictyobacter vulcani]
MTLIIPCTERFIEALEGFNKSERTSVVKKVRLFMANPTSKSLKVHRYMAIDNVWEFYVDRRMRVLFERLEGQLHLTDVGFHAILQKACRYRYISYTHVLYLDEDEYYYSPGQNSLATVTETPIALF